MSQKETYMCNECEMQHIFIIIRDICATKRFDFVKYNVLREGGGADDMEELTGRLMLAFRVKCRSWLGDFAFIRRLKEAPRRHGTHFALMDAEKAINRGGVRSPAAARLGKLWTWATLAQSGARGLEDPRYDVVPAEALHTTVCMMPKWRKDTADWEVASGVWENPYLLESRVRPPFVACTCTCNQEGILSSSDEEQE